MHPVALQFALQLFDPQVTSVLVTSVLCGCHSNIPVMIGLKPMMQPYPLHSIYNGMLLMSIGYNLTDECRLLCNSLAMIYVLIMSTLAVLALVLLSSACGIASNTSIKSGHM